MELYKYQPDHLKCKKAIGDGFLQLKGISPIKTCSVHVKVLLMELRTLHSECSLSGCLQCEGYY